MQSGSLKNTLYIVAIAATLMLTIAIGTGTYLGYKWFTDTHLPSTDKNGEVHAKVVRATLFGRNDLRVGRLSGVVQGVSSTSRLWGWLPASQIIKAPFTVDYFIGLAQLSPSNIMMSEDGRHILINAPDVFTEKPNIDLANTSLNDVRGVFVTRGAMAEMGMRAAASAQRVAADRAQATENVVRTREFARRDLTRLFEGALRAAKVDADVQVRFPGERPPTNEHWDVSRSIQDVIRDFS